MLAVCGVQMAPRRGAAESNVRMARSAIEAAAGEGARLIVFPEASLTGYVFHDKDSAREAAVEAGGPELAEVADAPGRGRVGRRRGDREGPRFAA